MLRPIERHRFHQPRVDNDAPEYATHRLLIRCPRLRDDWYPTSPTQVDDIFICRGRYWTTASARRQVCRPHVALRPFEGALFLLFVKVFFVVGEHSRRISGAFEVDEDQPLLLVLFSLTSSLFFSLVKNVLLSKKVSRVVRILLRALYGSLSVCVCVCVRVVSARWRVCRL